MKLNKTTWIVFGLLILISSLYRVWDGRPTGFTPLFAMALFSGFIIKNRTLAVLLPLLSLFISDVLYQVLYMMHLTEMKGFYEGQIINYVLIGIIPFIGMLIKKLSFLNVTLASIAAPTVYFCLSNLSYWIGGGVDIRTMSPLSKSIDGLLQSFNQALPFYKGYLASTLIFSAVFFGGYYLIQRLAPATRKAI